MNETESQLSAYGFGHQSRLSMHYFPVDSSYNIIESQKTSKTIYDPIHGHITFSKLMWDIIDTPQFQRLRNLKQLSTSYFIYPGNNHTRFEHCLGTGFLSKDLIDRCFDLVQKNKNENINLDLNEIEYYKNCVSIAGLCHDIGHGPFSHSFELILENLGIKDWDHEEFGGKIIKYLIDENNIEGIDNDMLKMINSLIDGNNLHNTEYNWIYQIVANKENSIDVDKFDYIQRDIYHSGVKTLSVDYTRIFKDINIINDNICFSEKTDMSLHSLFQARYCLHHKIYNHPQSICVESMIKDALLLSKDYFKFEEAITSVEKFIKLDDTILNTMLTFSLNSDEEIRTNKNLLSSEKLIKKVYNREFYNIIGEIPIPIGKKEEPKLDEFLCNENPKDEFYLTENDIIGLSENIFKDRYFNSVYCISKEGVVYFADARIIQLFVEGSRVIYENKNFLLYEKYKVLADLLLKQRKSYLDSYSSFQIDSVKEKENSMNTNIVKRGDNLLKSKNSFKKSLASQTAKNSYLKIRNKVLNEPEPKEKKYTSLSSVCDVLTKVYRGVSYEIKRKERSLLFRKNYILKNRKQKKSHSKSDKELNMTIDLLQEIENQKTSFVCFKKSKVASMKSLKSQRSSSNIRFKYNFEKNSTENKPIYNNLILLKNFFGNDKGIKDIKDDENESKKNQMYDLMPLNYDALWKRKDSNRKNISMNILKANDFFKNMKNNNGNVNNIRLNKLKKIQLNRKEMMNQKLRNIYYSDLEKILLSEHFNNYLHPK